MTYVPIIALIFGLVYFLFPRIENYYKRPLLIIELEPNDGITKIQTPLGLSSKNQNKQTNDPDEFLYNYEFEWKFNLIIRNNSENNAYDIKTLQKNNMPKIEFQKKINFQKALKAHEELNLPFKIVTIVEVLGKDREEIFDNDPNIFKDLSISLEYKNYKKNIFFSTFNFNDSSTSHKKILNYELKFMYYSHRIN